MVKDDDDDEEEEEEEPAPAPAPPPAPAPVEQEKQLSKKELKQKELEELDAALAELGVQVDDDAKGAAAAGESKAAMKRRKKAEREAAEAKAGGGSGAGADNKEKGTAEEAGEVSEETGVIDPAEARSGGSRRKWLARRSPVAAARRRRRPRPRRARQRRRRRTKPTSTKPPREGRLCPGQRAVKKVALRSRREGWRTSADGLRMILSSIRPAFRPSRRSSAPPFSFGPHGRRPSPSEKDISFAFASVDLVPAALPGFALPLGHQPPPALRQVPKLARANADAHEVDDAKARTLADASNLALLPLPEDEAHLPAGRGARRASGEAAPLRATPDRSARSNVRRSLRDRLPPRTSSGSHCRRSGPWPEPRPASAPRGHVESLSRRPHTFSADALPPPPRAPLTGGWWSVEYTRVSCRVTSADASISPRPGRLLTKPGGLLRTMVTLSRSHEAELAPQALCAPPASPSRPARRRRRPRGLHRAR